MVTAIVGANWGDEGKGKIKYSGSVNELYLDVSYLLYSLSAALNEDEKGKGDELMQKLKWYMNQQKEG